MPAREIYPSNTSETYGYSEGIKVGDTIYVAGTVGYAPDGSLPPDTEGQMRNCYAHIAKILAHFGASLADVVEQTVFVTDIKAAAAAMHVRKEAYAAAGPGVPTSAMVECRLGSPKLLVEIKVTARI